MKTMPTHQNIVSFTAVIQNYMKLFKTVHSKYHKSRFKLKYYSSISRCPAWGLKSTQNAPVCAVSYIVIIHLTFQFHLIKATHPPGHEVCRQTLGEPDDGCLGGAIGEPAGGALDGGGELWLVESWSRDPVLPSDWWGAGDVTPCPPLIGGELVTWQHSPWWRRPPSSCWWWSRRQGSSRQSPAPTPCNCQIILSRLAFLPRGSAINHVMNDSLNCNDILYPYLDHPEHTPHIDVPTALENVVVALKDAALVHVAENIYY